MNTKENSVNPAAQTPTVIVHSHPELERLLARVVDLLEQDQAPEVEPTAVATEDSHRPVEFEPETDT